MLLSCGDKTIGEHKAEISRITRPSNPTSQVKDAFHWDWEKSKENILLSSSVMKYVAKGQEIIDTARGDIDEDNIEDLMVVTAVLKEDSLQYINNNLPRQLLVFLGQSNGKYIFAFRNKKAIPCIFCCGMTDPYAGMSIIKGRLTINEYCASNYKSISEHRFLFVSKLRDWLLDTVVTESYSFHYENYELDTATKKDFGNVSLKTFVMHKDHH